MDREKREHELHLLKAQQELEQMRSEVQNQASSVVKAKPPKLPHFQDGKDELDSYLSRF